MHTKLTNRPVGQVIAAIRALDLEAIRLRVMDAEVGEGWTREYAESVESAYRDYLAMLVKHPDKLEDITVGKDVDEFWHAHILHTMKYTEDCKRVFGKYLHHNPHVGERTAADIEKRAALAEKTRRLYQAEFDGRRTQELIKSGGAAFCSAAVRATEAGFCSAAVSAENTAFCSAVVEAENAAFCSAVVKAKNVGFCSAGIEGRKRAFCSAALRPTAFCSAAVKPPNVAFCSAAVQDRAAAFCSAVVETEYAA